MSAEKIHNSEIGEPISVYVRVRPRLDNIFRPDQINNEIMVHGTDCISVVDESHVKITPHYQCKCENCIKKVAIDTKINKFGNKLKDDKIYKFDRVFSETSSQENIYDGIAEIVLLALQGFNSTVFAYGPTGTGKTYTMLGTEKEPGIIPRATEDIFQIMDNTKAQGIDVLFHVEMSFVEMYNNGFRNLLRQVSDELDRKQEFVEELDVSDELDELLFSSVLDSEFDAFVEKFPDLSHINDKITLHESANTGVFLNGPNLRIPVRSSMDALRLISLGTKMRAVGNTKTNQNSSRSHAILTFHVESKVTMPMTPVPEDDSLTDGEPHKTRQELRLGKIHLIDLAGSERGVAGSTSKSNESTFEATSINKSLLALGEVLHALAVNASVLSKHRRRQSMEGERDTSFFPATPGFDVQASGGRRRRSMGSTAGSVNSGSEAPVAGPSGLMHVPYLNSKLTHLLKDALGGNCQTVMILTMGPESEGFHQSLQSLQYAYRTRKVHNHPFLNRIEIGDSMLDVTDEYHLLKQLKTKINENPSRRRVSSVHGRRTAGRRPSVGDAEAGWPTSGKRLTLKLHGLMARGLTYLSFPMIPFLRVTVGGKAPRCTARRLYTKDEVKFPDVLDMHMALDAYNENAELNFTIVNINAASGLEECLGSSRSILRKLFPKMKKHTTLKLDLRTPDLLLCGNLIFSGVLVEYQPTVKSPISSPALKLKSAAGRLFMSTDEDEQKGDVEGDYLEAAGELKDSESSPMELSASMTRTKSGMKSGICFVKKVFCKGLPLRRDSNSAAPLSPGSAATVNEDSDATKPVTDTRYIVSVEIAGETKTSSLQQGMLHLKRGCVDVNFSELESVLMYEVDYDQMHWETIQLTIYDAPVGCEDEKEWHLVGTVDAPLYKLAAQKDEQTGMMESEWQLRNKQGLLTGKVVLALKLTKMTDYHKRKSVPFAPLLSRFPVPESTAPVTDDTDLTERDELGIPTTFHTGWVKLERVSVERLRTFKLIGKRIRFGHLVPGKLPEHIKETELEGKQDPFLVFNCEETWTSYSHVMSEQGNSCVWDDLQSQLFVSKEDLATKEIIVSAYDRNVGRPDTLVGACALPLLQLVQAPPVSGEHKFSMKVKLINKLGKPEGDMIVEGTVIEDRGRWLTGTVIGVKPNGFYDLQYDNKDFDAEISKDLIRLTFGHGMTPLAPGDTPGSNSKGRKVNVRPRFAVGTKVEVNDKGMGLWFPAELVMDHGDGTYDVSSHFDIQTMHVSEEHIQLLEFSSGYTPRASLAHNSFNITEVDDCSTDSEPDTVKEDTAADELQLNDRVEGNFQNRGTWIPGTIWHIHVDPLTGMKEYDIDFFTGEMERGVPEERVRPGPQRTVDGTNMLQDVSIDAQYSPGTFNKRFHRSLSEGGMKLHNSMSMSASRRSMEPVLHRDPNYGRFDRSMSEVAMFTVGKDANETPEMMRRNSSFLIVTKSRYSKGDRVKVNYRGHGVFFPATIELDRANGFYDVLYDAGELEEKISEDLLRPLLPSGAEDKKQLFKVGDKVEGNYRELGKWCIGVIRRIRGNGTIDIDYVDGHIESKVSPSNIRMIQDPNAVEEKRGGDFLVGENVEVNSEGNGFWYRATVRRFLGEGKYDVHYEDGDFEAGVPKDRIRTTGTYAAAFPSLKPIFKVGDRVKVKSQAAAVQDEIHLLLIAKEKVEKERMSLEATKAQVKKAAIALGAAQERVQSEAIQLTAVKNSINADQEMSDQDSVAEERPHISMAVVDKAIAVEESVAHLAEKAKTKEDTLALQAAKAREAEEARAQALKVSREQDEITARTRCEEPQDEIVAFRAARIKAEEEAKALKAAREKGLDEARSLGAARVKAEEQVKAYVAARSKAKKAIAAAKQRLRADQEARELGIRLRRADQAAEEEKKKHIHRVTSNMDFYDIYPEEASALAFENDIEGAAPSLKTVQSVRLDYGAIYEADEGIPYPSSAYPNMDVSDLDDDSSLSDRSVGSLSFASHMSPLGLARPSSVPRRDSRNKVVANEAEVLNMLDSPSVDFGRTSLKHVPRPRAKIDMEARRATSVQLKRVRVTEADKEPKNTESMIAFARESLKKTPSTLSMEPTTNPMRAESPSLRSVSLKPVDPIQGKSEEKELKRSDSMIASARGSLRKTLSVRIDPKDEPTEDVITPRTASKKVAPQKTEGKLNDLQISSARETLKNRDNLAPAIPQGSGNESSSPTAVIARARASLKMTRSSLTMLEEKDGEMSSETVPAIEKQMSSRPLPPVPGEPNKTPTTGTRKAASLRLSKSPSLGETKPIPRVNSMKREQSKELKKVPSRTSVTAPTRPTDSPTLARIGSMSKDTSKGVKLPPRTASSPRKSNAAAPFSEDAPPSPQRLPSAPKLDASSLAETAEVKTPPNAGLRVVTTVEETTKTTETTEPGMEGPVTTPKKKIIKKIIKKKVAEPGEGVTEGVSVEPPTEGITHSESEDSRATTPKKKIIKKIVKKKVEPVEGAAAEGEAPSEPAVALEKSESEENRATTPRKKIIKIVKKKPAVETIEGIAAEGSDAPAEGLPPSESEDTRATTPKKKIIKIIKKKPVESVEGVEGGTVEPPTEGITHSESEDSRATTPKKKIIKKIVKKKVEPVEGAGAEGEASTEPAEAQEKSESEENRATTPKKKIIKIVKKKPVESVEGEALEGAEPPADVVPPSESEDSIATTPKKKIIKKIIKKKVEPVEGLEGETVEPPTEGITHSESEDSRATTPKKKIIKKIVKKKVEPVEGAAAEGAVDHPESDTTAPLKSESEDSASTQEEKPKVKKVIKKVVKKKVESVTEETPSDLAETPAVVTTTETTVVEEEETKPKMSTSTVVKTEEEEEEDSLSPEEREKHQKEFQEKMVGLLQQSKKVDPVADQSGSFMNNKKPVMNQVVDDPALLKELNSARQQKPAVAVPLEDEPVGDLKTEGAKVEGQLSESLELLDDLQKPIAVSSAQAPRPDYRAEVDTSLSAEKAGAHFEQAGQALERGLQNLEKEQQHKQETLSRQTQEQSGEATAQGSFENASKIEFPAAAPAPAVKETKPSVPDKKESNPVVTEKTIVGPPKAAMPAPRERSTSIDSTSSRDSTMKSGKVPGAGGLSRAVTQSHSAESDSEFEGKHISVVGNPLKRGPVDKAHAVSSKRPGARGMKAVDPQLTPEQREQLRIRSEEERLRKAQLDAEEAKKPPESAAEDDAKPLTKKSSEQFFFNPLKKK